MEALTSRGVFWLNFLGCPDILHPSNHHSLLFNTSIVPIFTSSLSPAHNRKYCKNSYFVWPQLKGYLSISFDILPQMYMDLGLLKMPKKNFFSAVHLAISLYGLIHQMRYAVMCIVSKMAVFIQLLLLSQWILLYA